MTNEQIGQECVERWYGNRFLVRGGFLPSQSSQEGLWISYENGMATQVVETPTKQTPGILKVKLPSIKVSWMPLSAGFAYQLVGVVSGEGKLIASRFNIDHQIHPIRAGDLAFLPSRTKFAVHAHTDLLLEINFAYEEVDELYASPEVAVAWSLEYTEED